MNLGAYLDHVTVMHEAITAEPERHKRFKLALLEDQVREWQEPEAQFEILRLKRGRRR